MYDKYQDIDMNPTIIPLQKFLIIPPVIQTALGSI